MATEGKHRSGSGHTDGAELTFWEHLDVLRGSLIRMIVAAIVAAVLAFCLKEPLFSVVLAPADGSFFIYRLLGGEPFRLHLINTGLTEQFMIHMKVALMGGVLIASPYLLYVLFRFVSPALYENERRVSVRLVVAAYIMFMVGVAANYMLIFPLIPVVSWMLARFGMLRARWMRRFRRHAVVAILVVSAVITPTADVFTLVIVALPIWLLYELSIVVVRSAELSSSADDAEELDSTQKPIQI